MSYVIPEDSANALVEDKHIHMKIWGDANVKIGLKLWIFVVFVKSKPNENKNQNNSPNNTEL